MRGVGLPHTSPAVCPPFPAATDVQEGCHVYLQRVCKIIGGAHTLRRYVPDGWADAWRDKLIDLLEKCGNRFRIVNGGFFDQHPGPCGVALLRCVAGGVLYINIRLPRGILRVRPFGEGEGGACRRSVGRCARTEPESRPAWLQELMGVEASYTEDKHTGICDVGRMVSGSHEQLCKQSG